MREIDSMCSGVCAGAQALLSLKPGPLGAYVCVCVCVSQCLSLDLSQLCSISFGLSSGPSLFPGGSATLSR